MISKTSLIHILSVCRWTIALKTSRMPLSGKSSIILPHQTTVLCPGSSVRLVSCLGTTPLPNSPNNLRKCRSSSRGCMVTRRRRARTTCATPVSEKWSITPVRGLSYLCWYHRAFGRKNVNETIAVRVLTRPLTHHTNTSLPFSFLS